MGAYSIQPPAEYNSGDLYGSGIRQAASFEKGGVPIPPMTSVHPEAPDTLLEALQGASIVEEHRILMGTVVERVQPVKSGLTEACTSLLTGFEVCDVIMQKECHSIDSSPRDSVRCSERKAGQSIK